MPTFPLLRKPLQYLGFLPHAKYEYFPICFINETKNGVNRRIQGGITPYFIFETMF